MRAVADVQAGQGKSKRKGKKKAHQQGKPAGLVIAPNNAAATAKVACISLTAGMLIVVSKYAKHVPRAVTTPV